MMMSMFYCVIFDMSSIYGTSLVTAFFLSYRQKRNISRIDFFSFFCLVAKLISRELVVDLKIRISHFLFQIFPKMAQSYLKKWKIWTFMHLFIGHRTCSYCNLFMSHSWGWNRVTTVSVHCQQRMKDVSKHQFVSVKYWWNLRRNLKNRKHLSSYHLSTVGISFR